MNYPSFKGEPINLEPNPAQVEMLRTITFMLHQTMDTASALRFHVLNNTSTSFRMALKLLSALDNFTTSLNENLYLQMQRYIESMSDLP